ncbi:hypothetical protein BGZ68_000559, partial [Mortierella alpina]
MERPRQKDLVDSFVQSRSQLSGQHRRFTDTDESNRPSKGRVNKSQDLDSAHERRREDRDRKERKADRQEDPDNDFEKSHYLHYNTKGSPQMVRKRLQLKSSPSTNEQRQSQGPFSPIPTSRKSVQSPTFTTPPRLSQTPKKKGTPIAIPSSSFTQLERPRHNKPSTPTYTPTHVSRKTAFPSSPTPKPSITKGLSTNLKIGRHSPLLDSDSDLEEDIFSGAPQGIQKTPKETGPIGLTRSVSASSSSSRDFEETRHIRQQNKKIQYHDRSQRTASKGAGLKKSPTSANDGSDGDDDDDRSDFQPNPARPDRRALDVRDRGTKKSHNRVAAAAVVDARPKSWQINEENKERHRDLFAVSSRMIGGGKREGSAGAVPSASARKPVVGKHGATDIIARRRDSHSGIRSGALSSKSSQGTSNDEMTKKSRQGTNTAESTPDPQRKKFLGLTTPSTISASSKDRLSPSTPRGRATAASNSMPSPADDNAALELFVLDHGDDNEIDDDGDDDDKPRRKRRNRRSQSNSSSSDSDRPARSSEGPMTPKRDIGSKAAKSGQSGAYLEAASHKSPESAVKHTGPRFSLPSPSKKKIRMTIPSDLVFLSDDEIPAQALNDDEESKNICPYCGDALPKTQRMATALKSVLAKLAREQEQRKLLHQQYLQQRQQQQQQQLQQQQQVPIIDLEADDLAGHSTSSVMSESKRRKAQPRPRPLKRNHTPSKPLDDKNNTLVVLDDDDHCSEDENDDDDDDDSYDARDDPTNPLSLYPPKVSLMEKFEFCRIHDAEALVVPMGIREEYPMHIDFSKLDERVAKLEPDLRGIIERSVRSPYLEKALNNYERMGTLGARRPHVVLANVDQTL